VRIARPVLVAIALIVAGSTVPHAAPSPRTPVENAIAFLAATGHADAIDAAARLRNMLDDGKIVVGDTSQPHEVARTAWTANGIISLNPNQIGDPRPYVDVDWSPTPENRKDWVDAFRLAQALVRELSNTPVGDTRAEKVEGWRESLSGATLWLRLMEAHLQLLPPSIQAELAHRLGAASSEVRASVKGAVHDLGSGGFSDLQWRNPDGGVFRSEEEAMQYLADFEARMAAFHGEVAEPSAPEPAEPDEATWNAGYGTPFCCQWLHPVKKVASCRPARNRVLCNSLPQGAAVEKAYCMASGPHAGHCQSRQD
jgi:hypothetical protein